MFRKILIANRGEIALRVLRACREMGIPSVVVYSEADRDSLPVRLADESYCIGPPAPAGSYLNMASIVGVARLCGADAIHPGYGFLAENAAFAEMCAEAGITFIGPPPEVLRKTGDKARAREAMVRAGVPVVPGTTGTVGDPEEAVRVAAEIGYPVMVKAACGGGGRGMRVAHGEADLRRALRAAGAEAEYAFGSPAVYLEKYLEEPRHVEVQVLADNYGQMIHLGERDCSVQRRNQKLLEEAPSVAVTPELRRRLGETALAAARAVGYRNAGTVEFLLDKQRNFYFIE
ncbi:MAG: ATP-grasp domain-containing protein, partial [Firmicutes bacterium]|nr:ATP-grasp domain-containing protein [Bacillota bacterium]